LPTGKVSRFLPADKYLLIWKRKTSDAMRIGRFLLPYGILDIFYKKIKFDCQTGAKMI